MDQPMVDSSLLALIKQGASDTFSNHPYTFLSIFVLAREWHLPAAWQESAKLLKRDADMRCKYTWAGLRMEEMIA